MGTLVYLGGTAELAALIGFQILLVGGLGFLIVGVRSSMRLARTDKAELMERHQHELSAYADTMTLCLERGTTPWRHSHVRPLFQEHWPGLTDPVMLWLNMARAEQKGPVPFVPKNVQIRAQAKLKLNSIASGYIDGTCARCREIEKRG